MIAAAVLAALAAAVSTPVAPPATDYRARPPAAEVIYFLLPDRFANGDPANDRGGLAGGPAVTGFDPTNKAFFHGGDLKGVEEHLDYIQQLGATAIWVAPILKNKPVQGGAGHLSAAYHGYWIEDFLHVDPHFGYDADFKALVDAAHRRNLKVYMDIVVNHTADVIQYRECLGVRCPYRSLADYPYTLKGNDPAHPINEGFQGDDVQTAANFARLTNPNYAYTPFVPAAEAHAKNPAWLNDPIFYHNRGSTTFQGENSTYGDFGGLDDLYTENPRVLAGMIDIYGSWIDRFGVDGFRIDTAQHVNAQFWQAFAPAMLARAKAKGIPNFHIFGEVSIGDMNPAHLARYTQVDRLPAVLDFAFMHAVIDTVADTKGTDELGRLFEADALYRGGEPTAGQLPTFLGNHDQGRFAMFVRKARPQASESEVLARTVLGHAMLLTLRGVPTIYSGDEQGFAGLGDDQASREDLFASRTPSYAAEKLIGQDRTGAADNYGTDGPLFRAIATFARLRTAHPALSLGRQLVRHTQPTPGLFAVSRFDPQTNGEVVVAFNTSDQPIAVNVLTEATSLRFRSLYGACPVAARAPGSLPLTIPPLGTVVCAAATAR